MNYEKIKPLFFKLDPENAHHLVVNLLKIAEAVPQVLNGWVEKNFIYDNRLRQEIFKKEFLNPIGLAAGFDKNGEMIRSMTALGFGFTEIGTVTPKPQPGNPRPRLWRHVDEESLQNAMGFNNKGSAYMEKRLKKIYPYATVIGVNIGKNKSTSEDDAINDYKHGIKVFQNLCDYLVINISSPNTPGLRDLQNEKFIESIFKMGKEITQKPILLKISPDIQKSQAVDLCARAVESGADGIIATNTSIDYSLLKTPQKIGGISGKVIKEKSFEIFEAIAKELFKKSTLISVGGIDSAEEAYRRIRAGASLVQILSGLIFKGPSIAADINKEILKLLQEDGFSHIKEAIGADRR